MVFKTWVRPGPRFGGPSWVLKPILSAMQWLVASVATWPRGFINEAGLMVSGNRAMADRLQLLRLSTSANTSHGPVADPVQKPKCFEKVILKP